MRRGAWAVMALALAAALAPQPAVADALPELTASGAVLWDPDDDLVLLGVEETVSRPMASLTKVMTVLLALEAGAIDDTVTVSPAAAALGEATLNLQAGQQVPMESLVAGLILRSGNDAAVALAEHVAGSEQAFVALMNARALELGLTGTHFVNAHGLTNDPRHRSSPLDLARLAHEAMGHAVFARYARAAEATVPGLAPMESRNELLGAYEWATGVKTGFTLLAGFSLLASAERDGRVLYAVVLDSADRFGEAAALLDYGFEAFRRVEPATPGEAVTRYRWADADVPVTAPDGLALTVARDADVRVRLRLAPHAPRPVRAGDVLGEAELWVDGQPARRAPLVAVREVGDRPEASAAARVGGGLQEALRAFGRLADVDRAA